NSNDECGPKCDSQMQFVKNFKGVAQILEKKSYTQFTPHYMTWYCPEGFLSSKWCKSRCINHGRYCAPDPEHDFSKGYDGKDVVIQNLRQTCLFKVANESGKPWLWWDYVTDFAIRCPMNEKKYTKGCAEEVIKALGIDLKKINKCMGDPDADEDNPVLKAEQDAQVSTSFCWIIILESIPVEMLLFYQLLLLTIGSIEVSVLSNHDTFHGRLCECPVVEGVKFVGDGYTHCKASDQPYISFLQSYMDSEIRAIMAQYMPLENLEAQSHIRNDQS
ncbi:hypothetical protein GW17_00054395, partial [Ensete ventricosum]